MNRKPCLMAVCNTLLAAVAVIGLTAGCDKGKETPIGTGAAPETRRERRSVAADDEKLAIHGCHAGFHGFRASLPVLPLSCIGVLKDRLGSEDFCFIRSCGFWV